MNDRTTACGRQVRSWALPSLLAMALTGCGGKTPDITFPDYLSPESRKVLLDARHDLIACQSVQAALTFAEIISLSDPVGYANGMVGSSVGQGKPDLPVDGALQTMITIDKICCMDIKRRVNLVYAGAKLERAIDRLNMSSNEKKMSNKEFRFWEKMYFSVEKKDCQLPNQIDPDLGWPSG